MKQRSSPAWMAGRAGHLTALIAGALYPLGLAPLEIWPLSLLSVLLFLHLLKPLAPAAAAFRGWWFGLGFFGCGTSWVFVSIHEHGPAPIWLAGLLTLIFVACLALLFLLHGYLFRRLIRNTPLALLIGFPALWVLMEWFRSWFLTGFPWLLLGYAPLDTWLAGWAPLGGVYSLTLLSSLSAVSLYLAITANNTSVARLALGLLSLLPWLAGGWLQTLSWTTAQREAPISVSLVQGNIPQKLKWDPRYRLQLVDTYLSMTENEVGRALIVWPETAIPLFEDQARTMLEPWSERLAQAGSTLVTGLPHRERQNGRLRYHNSIMALGAGEGLYHKRRLVPFGEYVPLEAQLRGLIEFFDLPMSNFALGPELQPPLLADGQRIGASICYEVVYPDLIAEQSLGTSLLLTISNDSWFGNSWAPHQHQQMARMRALENGRYLVRATNNGISSLIDDRGHLLTQSAQFEQQVTRGEVRLMQGATPFTRSGSWPTLLLSALLLLIATPFLAQAPRRNTSMVAK